MGGTVKFLICRVFVFAVGCALLIFNALRRPETKSEGCYRNAGDLLATMYLVSSILVLTSMTPWPISVGLSVGGEVYELPRKLLLAIAGFVIVGHIFAFKTLAQEGGCGLFLVAPVRYVLAVFMVASVYVGVAVHAVCRVPWRVSPMPIESQETEVSRVTESPDSFRGVNFPTIVFGDDDEWDPYGVMYGRNCSEV